MRIQLMKLIQLNWNTPAAFIELILLYQTDALQLKVKLKKRISTSDTKKFQAETKWQIDGDGVVELTICEAERPEAAEGVLGEEFQVGIAGAIEVHVGHFLLAVEPCVSDQANGHAGEGNSGPHRRRDAQQANGNIQVKGHDDALLFLTGDLHMALQIINFTRVLNKRFLFNQLTHCHLMNRCKWDSDRMWSFKSFSLQFFWPLTNRTKKIKSCW